MTIVSHLIPRRLQIFPLVGHTDYINDLSFGGPDGDTLASVGDDLTCRLWNAADYTPLACIASDGPCELPGTQEARGAPGRGWRGATRIISP